MIKTIRLGTDDLEQSRAFYDATFGALGVGPADETGEHPIVMYSLPGGVKFMLGAARDGKPATHANGGTIVFEANAEADVGAWHAAGLANGGTCEGKPEPKPLANGAVGAYLRDPSGNKLGVYHGLTMW